MRPIDGVGVELRYQWDGELRVSQMFKAWAELEASATEKRQELEARAGTQRRRCAILRVSYERRGRAPWADVLLDYDIIPIVEVEKAVELLKKAIAFRKG